MQILYESPVLALHSILTWLSYLLEGRGYHPLLGSIDLNWWESLCSFEVFVYDSHVLRFWFTWDIFHHWYYYFAGLVCQLNSPVWECSSGLESFEISGG